MTTTTAEHRPVGPGLHTHACAAFDGPEAWLDQALAFLGHGLSGGQQLHLYASSVPPERLAALGDAEALVEEGRLVLGDAGAAYADFDPEGQVEHFRGVASAARSAGFTGIRVAADVSAQAGADLGAWARYEHLVDGLIGREAIAGLCGFDRTALGDDVDRLACLHAVGPEAPFRLVAGAGGPRLQGEVDALSAALLDWALAAAVGPGDGSAPLVVDARDVTFLDHHAMAALDRAGRAAGRPVQVLTRLRTPALIADLVGLDHVVVERV